MKYVDAREMPYIEYSVGRYTKDLHSCIDENVEDYMRIDVTSEQFKEIKRARADCQGIGTESSYESHIGGVLIKQKTFSIVAIFEIRI